MIQEKVREFHEAFGVEGRDRPGLISEERSELRRKLIQEELDEYVEAVQAGDMVGIADAIADLLVVVYGTAEEHGVDIDWVVDIVHDSNMSKLDARGNPVPHATIPGKIGKSDLYWEPGPYIKEELELQGWESDSE